MAKATKTTVSKTAKVAVAKSFSVSIHKPGEMPADMKVKAGTKVQDIVDQLNLKGYEVSVNGSTATLSSNLVKGDVIRIGLKTKNAF